MNAAVLNWSVVVGYFIATVWLGERFAGKQTSIDDYFLAGRSMSWRATALSIVGTETSTLTFVGVPAIAFGADLTFLQLAMGYVIGRWVVAWIFVPAYFAGRIRTAYELLSGRFGPGVRRLASAIFVVSRCLADGVRLFATALVLQALLPVPLWLAIGLVTAVTAVYTLRGGLRAVILNDAVQLGVYMSGAALAIVLILLRLPQGWEGAVSLLQPLGKLRWLDPVWDWTRPYGLWSGLIGGAVLTMATHGTDQMFVQRLLACGSQRDARRAVVASGFLVLAQMLLFLLVGSLLFAFYNAYPDAVGFTSNDQVFPRFIAEQMPAGLGGLVIAAVFAAAMSTLSSSMSSLASASVLDFTKAENGLAGEAGSVLHRSRGATLGWAVVLAAVAFVAQAWGSVLEAGLTITSITFGGVLGVFVVGVTGWRVPQTGAIVAVLAGIVSALVAQQLTPLAWTWLTPLGAAMTVAVAALFRGGRRA